MENKVTMYCNVDFVYSDKVLKSKLFRTAMRKQFIKQRKGLVDLLNSGAIDRFNAEFDTGHTYYDGIYYGDEYMKYMKECQQIYANRFNATNGCRWMELYITDECDIAGRLTSNHDATIEAYIYNLRESL